MMTARTGLALMILAGTLFADSPFECFGSNSLGCRMQRDRAWLEFFGEEMAAAGEAKRKFNQDIADRRARYFATYPDKPGAQEAKDAFAALLQAKDIYYMQLALTFESLTIAGRPKDTVPNYFDFVAGGQTMDGGIRPSAKDEFNLWVGASRKYVAPGVRIKTGAALMTADQVAKLLNGTKEEYSKYVELRDYWEFNTAGRTLPDYIVPAEYNTKQKYGEFLYFRFGEMPLPDALADYAQMVKVLGASAVEGAAEQVRIAPKTPTGTRLVVTARPPVTTGPGGTTVPDRSAAASENVIGTYAGPLFAFETLATRGDDRRYLLDLLADNNYLAPRDRSRHIGKWEYAGTAYARLVSAFGEQTVLEAARQVRTALKRRTDGAVTDAAAIGATRYDPYPAFEDIVARNNPRGYVRALLAVSQKLNSPAEVDAAYQKFLAANNETAVLDAAKRLAVGKPHPAYAGDLDLLARSLTGSSSVTAPPEVPATSAEPAAASPAVPSNPPPTRGRIAATPNPAPQPLQPAVPPRPAVQGDAALATRQRYNAALMRARRDLALLAIKEAPLIRQGSALPSDIRSARDRLTVGLQKVASAMGRNDIAQANQDLETMESTVREIDKFLGQ